MSALWSQYFEVPFELAVFFSPIWLLVIALAIGIIFRKRKEVWTRPSVLALPVASISIVLGEIVMAHLRSFDVNNIRPQDLQLKDVFLFGFGGYCVGWIIIRGFRFVCRRGG